MDLLWIREYLPLLPVHVQWNRKNDITMLVHMCIVNGYDGTCGPMNGKLFFFTFKEHDHWPKGSVN